MTILEENHHSFLIVEHDPMLYEDAKQMVEYVGQALKQTSREATILLYASALDPHLQTITELAAGVPQLRRRESTGERAGKRCLEQRPHWRRTHEVAMDKGDKAD
jgi:hypothetical protein